jgi:hypothetical protein
MQAIGNDLGSHGFTGATLTGEQGIDAQAAIHLVREAPLLVNGIALLHLRGQLMQYIGLFGGQYQVIPCCFGGKTLSQSVHTWTRADQAGIPEAIC